MAVGSIGVYERRRVCTADDQLTIDASHFFEPLAHVAGASAYHLDCDFVAAANDQLGRKALVEVAPAMRIQARGVKIVAATCVSHQQHHSPSGSLPAGTLSERRKQTEGIGEPT